MIRPRRHMRSGTGVYGSEGMMEIGNAVPARELGMVPAPWNILDYTGHQ